jgi:hypothetical protein
MKDAEAPEVEVVASGASIARVRTLAVGDMGEPMLDGDSRSEFLAAGACSL